MNNELYHHGVKGMKWGVRRYQNKDGTYIKKGLQRFDKDMSTYESAKADVKTAKQQYKSGKITKDSYKKKKNALKTSKKTLNKSYDQLKLDYRADQGRELYKRGKTITNNTLNRQYRSAGIIAATVIADAALKSTGYESYRRFAGVPISSLTPAAIAIGGAAVNTALSMKENSENKKLRAYYAH